MLQYTREIYIELLYWTRSQLSDDPNNISIWNIREKRALDPLNTFTVSLHHIWESQPNSKTELSTLLWHEIWTIPLRRVILSA